MKPSFAFGRVFLSVSALTLLGAPFLHSSAHAQSAPRKSRSAGAARLEIWPGQRVLLVMPLALGADWNESAELGAALLPVVQPELQRALASTGKFSLTLPYTFDPVLRRAIYEKALSEADVKSFVDAPSLTSAAPIVANLRFEQPTMATIVTLDEIRVGGTPANPTVQVKVSGRLYQATRGQGDFGTPFRSVSITSKPFSGKTPDIRVRSAAMQAFSELAEAFIEPPVSFSLPVPVVKAAPVAPKVAKPAPAKPPATVPTEPMIPPDASPARVPTPSPQVPTQAPVIAPAPVAPGQGLPAGTPPLGIDAPEEGN